MCLVQDSDAGSQYAAFRYTELLTAAGAVASIGTGGDPYDGALAESVIGLCKNQCVKHDGPFHAVDDFERRIWSWVRWFNHQRLHSSIEHMTRVELEQRYQRQNSSRQQPRLGEPARYQTKRIMIQRVRVQSAKAAAPFEQANVDTQPSSIVTIQNLDSLPRRPDR